MNVAMNQIMAIERTIDGALSNVGAMMLPAFDPLTAAIEATFPAYWKFMTRSLPKTTTSGFDAFAEGQFLKESIFWVVLFSSCFLLVPIISKKLFPKWYSSLSPTHRKDLPSYLVCMIHHLYAVPRSWKRIYTDWHVPKSQWDSLDYGPLDSVISPFCIGYLVADTLCYALPYLSAQYLVHHVITISIVLGGCSSNNYIGRFIPHLLVSDTTQLLYNSSWLLKRFGLKDSSPLCMTLEMLFALFFPCVRIFVMPMAFLTVTLNGSSKGFGLARFLFLPLCLLQYYWFSQIVRRLAGILTGTPPTKKNK